MSFVSLGLVLPILGRVVTINKSIITLVGPRFRTKEKGVNGGNVIDSPTIRGRILQSVLRFTSLAKFSIGGLDFSPVANKAKGVRFLIRLRTGSRTPKVVSPRVSDRRIIGRTCLRLGDGSVSVSSG